VLYAHDRPPQKINKAIEASGGRMLKINLDLRMSVFKAKNNIPYGIIVSHIE